MSLHRPIAFVLLLGIAAAHGQQPAVPPPVPVTPPGVPQPPAPAGDPGAELAPGQGGLPLGETKIVTDINEPKLSGSALAGLYRKYTGRRVIVSSAAAAAEFSFVQEASPDDPLTFAQAAELLKKAATIEEFIFVPDEQDSNLDFLTLSTGGIRPTRRGVDVYNENSVLPEGDAVITYVMTLSYIKPAEAVNTFTQIVGQFGTYASIAPVPNASAVVITENTSLIRKLIDLKKEIDKPGSVQGSRFIPVRYADVTEIADTLTQLLTAQQSAQKTAGIQRADAPPGAPGAAPGGGAAAGTAGEDTPVQIVPDPRTNRIFAMGRPVDLIFVESLVREFDVETSEKNFLRRKLKFLKVYEFLPIASDALTRAFSGTGAAGGATQGGPQGGQQGGGRTQQATQGGRQSGGRNTAATGSTGANFGGSSGRSGGGSASGGSGAALGDPNVNSAPESILVGRTLLVADNITNSVVVQGPPSGLEIIERLLDQIDVKPDQVMISTVIGQLTLSDKFELGLDYLNVGDDHAIRGGGGHGPNLPIIKKFDPGSLAAGSGLQVYGKIGNNLNVYLKALQQKTDFTVLSRPSIFTSNNQKGTISSGERIAIPTSSNSFGSSGNSSTNIEYQDVVLKLEVIPLVNSPEEITMQIALLSDEQNGTQTIAGAGSNGNDLTVPRISTREILTTVTVPNNETIVLGGLIIAKNNKDRSGIPILSDIPYLGALFSKTNNNKDRTELMVFMQPSVVSNASTLNAVQIDMDARYKVSGNVRELADGPDTLPPLNTVEVLDGKGGTQVEAIPVPRATYETNTSSSTIRPSIRPLHRR